MPNLSESQKAVLQKYLVEGETTWEQVAQRVCKFIADVEETSAKRAYWYNQFLSIVEPMEFVPAGSVLANSGHGTEGLNNCFVLSSEDNIQDIVQLVADSLMTTKFRGGVGINIGSEGQQGYIRPKGTPYKDGVALGPCAVLDMVSETCAKLTTGNKSRRGAYLFSMHWKHPDIHEFIEAKTQSKIDAKLFQRALEGEVSESEAQQSWVETHLSPVGKRERRWHNANISVQLDQEFYDLLEAKEGYVVDLWNKIAQFAHDTADPGLLHIDIMQDKSVLKDRITTTNPCGEAVLPPNSSCNLGSINLTKFWKDGRFDFYKLQRATKIAIRFLDNVLTASKFATEKQRHIIQDQYRQLGLGIMGWADVLKMASIAYDSQQNLNFIRSVGQVFATSALQASEELADEKGACGAWDEICYNLTGNSFELWEIFHPNFPSILNGHSVKKFVESGQLSLKDCFLKPRRNADVTAIAPTGSIAQLAGCSWAFEPDFGLTVWKQVFVDASKMRQDWVQLLNPYLESLELSKRDAEVVKQTGSLQDTEFAAEYPETAAIYKIAREISPEWHIKVQAAWQEWITMSISKTCNLPADATVKDIQSYYHLARSLGLKGFTIYRAGTLESEPIKVGNQEKDV
jgi:ribonucleoside-diphosphate reductase alpha chain